MQHCGHHGDRIYNVVQKTSRKWEPTLLKTSACHACHHGGLSTDLQHCAENAENEQKMRASAVKNSMVGNSSHHSGRSTDLQHTTENEQKMRANAVKNSMVGNALVTMEVWVWIYSITQKLSRKWEPTLSRRQCSSQMPCNALVIMAVWVWIYSITQKMRNAGHLEKADDCKQAAWTICGKLMIASRLPGLYAESWWLQAGCLDYMRKADDCKQAAWTICGKLMIASRLPGLYAESDDC